jgi:hypothetical protein
METLTDHAIQMANEALRAADDYALAARHARDEEEENEFGYLAHRAEAEARRWMEVA